MHLLFPHCAMAVVAAKLIHIQLSRSVILSIHRKHSKTTWLVPTSIHFPCKTCGFMQNIMTFVTFVFTQNVWYTWLALFLVDEVQLSSDNIQTNTSYTQTYCL